MPRPATGSIVETHTPHGVTYALRFLAYGKRRFVTLPAGASRSEADLALQNVMADVRRGTWQAARARPSRRGDRAPHVPTSSRPRGSRAASPSCAWRPTAPAATSWCICCRLLASDDRRRDGCLRRPLLATFVFGGLRISEALSLPWRDVDLAGGRLRVDAAPDADETSEQNHRRRAAKTDAGVRWVPFMRTLRSELLARKMVVAAADP